jgi:hypothetical protein
MNSPCSRKFPKTANRRQGQDRRAALHNFIRDGAYRAQRLGRRHLVAGYRLLNTGCGAERFKPALTLCFMQFRTQNRYTFLPELL